MKLSNNDDHILDRIEKAENGEKELFAIIEEYGLSREQVLKIQEELKRRGIGRPGTMTITVGEKHARK